MRSFGKSKSLHFDDDKKPGQIKMWASDGGYDSVEIYFDKRSAVELAKFLVLEFDSSAFWISVTHSGISSETSYLYKPF